MNGVKSVGAEDVVIPEFDAVIDWERTEWEPEVPCTVLNLAKGEIGVVVLDDKAGESGDKEGCTVMRP